MNQCPDVKFIDQKRRFLYSKIFFVRLTSSSHHTYLFLSFFIIFFLKKQNSHGVMTFFYYFLIRFNWISSKWDSAVFPTILNAALEDEISFDYYLKRKKQQKLSFIVFLSSSSKENHTSCILQINIWYAERRRRKKNAPGVLNAFRHLTRKNEKSIRNSSKPFFVGLLVCCCSFLSRKR